MVEKIRMEWNDRIEKSEKIEWNGMIRMRGPNMRLVTSK